jgi:uncharacterized protein YfiM (DUF2279 family)
MKKLLIISLLVISNNAYAEIIWDDNWTGYDKTLHFGAGAIVGVAVTAYTDDSTTGTLAGCGVGISKEIYDMTNTDSATVQDAIVTCAGAYIGSKLFQGLYLTPNKLELKMDF